MSGAIPDQTTAAPELGTPAFGVGPAPEEHTKAAAALAYALWDSENTVRMAAEEIARHVERAESVMHWLGIHGYKVVPK